MNLTSIYLLAVVTLSFKIRQIKSTGQTEVKAGKETKQTIKETWIPKQTNAFFRHANFREC